MSHQYHIGRPNLQIKVTNIDLARCLWIDGFISKQHIASGKYIGINHNGKLISKSRWNIFSQWFFFRTEKKNIFYFWNFFSNWIFKHWISCNMIVIALLKKVYSPITGQHIHLWLGDLIECSYQHGTWP